MDRKGRLIALGICAAIGAAFAIPAIGGAEPPVSLARNAYAVSGFKVSIDGKKPRSIVPTQKNGKLPRSIIPHDTRVPAGSTVYGTIGVEFTAAAANAVAGSSASFPIPTPALLNQTNFGIVGGAFEDPECTGKFERPTAPAGHLCIYPGATANGASGYFSVDESEVLNIATNGEGNLEATPFLMTGRAGAYGFRVSVKAKAAGAAKFFATWAYTAPTGSAPTTT